MNPSQFEPGRCGNPFYPDLRRPLAIRFHPIPILRSFRRFFPGIESPIGFEVETLAVDVVDLATAFGVLQATGLMKFVAPGPGFVPGKYEDNDRIVVFAERPEVLLKSKLRVDLTASGCYQRINRQGEKLVPAGIRVRSYLLNFDPLGRMELRSSWTHGTECEEQAKGHGADHF